MAVRWWLLCSCKFYFCKRHILWSFLSFCYISILHCDMHQSIVQCSLDCENSILFMAHHWTFASFLVRCMSKLSDEFRRLCTNVDVYPHSIDVTPIHVLRCSVYTNFRMIWLWTLLLRTFKCFMLPLCCCGCLQCFDAVGWVAGRASGL